MTARASRIGIIRMLRPAISIVGLSGALLVMMGCTVIGYVAGDAIDEHHAKSKAVALKADSCACQEGDRAMLVLVSGDTLRGVIKEIAPGQHIKLIVRFSEPVTNKPAQIEEMQWVYIKSLCVIEKPKTWRIVLTSVGFAIDATAYIAMRAIAAGMSAASSLR